MFLAVAALGAGVSLPAHTQEDVKVEQADQLVLEEVIVTARRRKEALQDVPVSMTVFDQRRLDDANIINSGDLAAYTPSLQINPRFGQDTTTFAIRGFSQELRTTASVGVYFAEVVAPRGANSSVSGDGAGPGDFFDLQNVQVLKGPQGTLFGRNTTGGAILLTPNRPTDELEGYLEGSFGNYHMLGAQGVINVPVTDSFRMRFGVDHQERDGYLDNISDIGPDDFANVDYTALRASAVWDLTQDLENYTIVRWYESENNGYPGSIFACNPAQFLGALCQFDLDDRKANGKDGFHEVYSFVPDPVSEQEQWQVINTTTWDVTDNFLIKNILSYAELEGNVSSAIYGTNWQFPPGSPTSQHLIFQQQGRNEGRNATDTETFVWELQFQGEGFGGDLNWQAGLYYEKSEPNELYGAQSPSIIACDQSTVSSSNPDDFRCNQQLSANAGALNDAPGGVEYTNQAVYAQATWRFNEQWSTTAGIRYTDDETEGEITEYLYKFPNVAAGGYFPYTDLIIESRSPEQHSEEPTWLLGVDWTPTDDLLVYGKYARGYRQGSINLAGTTGIDTHGPEEVDTYEIGSKLTFSGAIAGTFNVAAFYNDFTDQQIQYGYFKPTGVGTTAVLNAGSSTIWGVEVETVLQLHETFVLSASYAYLDTEVDELFLPELPPGVPVGLDSLNTTTAEGEPLSYAPENELVMTGTYMFPFSEDWGDMSLAVTFRYTDEMQAVSEETSIYATLDSRELWDVSFNWQRIFGSGVDLSVFGTNVTDEEYITFLTGNWNSGLESGQVSVPRMYGARLRYNFGDY
jgi:iron complex outermembrane receptor protein